MSEYFLPLRCLECQGRRLSEEQFKKWFLSAPAGSAMDICSCGNPIDYNCRSCGMPVVQQKDWNLSKLKSVVSSSQFCVQDENWCCKKK
jgi:hypothetical protein